MSAIEYTMRTVSEWTEESDATCNEWGCRRSLVTGELAARVRERFGVKGRRVYFTETMEEEGGCPTCYETFHVLIVECGGKRARFSSSEGLPLPALLDWFDEPRRQVEREAAEQAKREQQERNAQAFHANVLTPIVDAMQQAEASGYRNDGEWHDAVMDALGVGGTRYGR